MIEIHSRNGWQPIAPGHAPAIGESELFHLRNLPVGSTLTIGDTITQTADTAGTVRIDLKTIDDLRGHIGLIPIRLDEIPLGEVEVIPDKMSQAAYDTLRRDLDAVWTGLVLDPSGISSLQAGPPPPHELWHRISQPIAQITEHPAERLQPEIAYRKARTVRRKSELTASVLRARARDGSALVRTVGRSQDFAENHMVIDLLRRLQTYAARTGDPHTARLASHAEQRLGITTTARHPLQIPPLVTMDIRYRQIHAARRLLLRPELEPVEGPGEVRFGVQGLARLYEYWIYLQVLLQIQALVGNPITGFDPLRVLTPHGVRLELGPGTTVTFPGDLHVAFEPAIRADHTRSWKNLKLIPHPNPDLSHQLATPDIVILRTGTNPTAIIIDAKYVGRSRVENAAAATHAKYARMLHHGIPVVTNVVVTHPHSTLPQRQWAGYGHLAMTPGTHIARLPLSPITTPADREPDATTPRPATQDDNRPDTVLVHQYWMREQLGPHRRIDLATLAPPATSGRVIVMPDLEALTLFAHACERAGWRVRYSGFSQADQAAALADEASKASAQGHHVICYTDSQTAHHLPPATEIRSYLPTGVINHGTA